MVCLREKKIKEPMGIFSTINSFSYHQAPHNLTQAAESEETKGSYARKSSKPIDITPPSGSVPKDEHSPKPIKDISNSKEIVIKDLIFTIEDLP